MARRSQSELDLFTPVVDEAYWHPNFRRIKDWASEQEHDVLRGWAKGFRDRDGKFVKEFQTTFNSSFWELYLYALFRTAGCDLDQSHARPDFVISSGSLGGFVAEAVIASNPEKLLPEWTWDPSEPPPPRQVMLDLACLRLSQAITSKYDKWKKGYSNLPHCKGRPFIVCVGPFEQPWASLQGTEAVDRVLFRGPRPIISHHEDKPLVVGYTVSDRIFKPSGKDVEMGLFVDARMSAISGVLFSSLATWSKVLAMADPGGRLLLFHGARLGGGGLQPFVLKGGEYSETIEEGAHLFLNSFADTPIDPTPFSRLGLGVHQISHTGTLTAIPSRGLLITRIASEIRINPEPLPRHEPPPDASRHVLALPPDDVPFAGPSRGPVTDQITLELHRGWTLFVGRDMVDNDWAVIAKRLVCVSLEQFVNARCAPNDEFMTDFFATRDAALAEARQRIDDLDQEPQAKGT